MQGIWIRNGKDISKLAVYPLLDTILADSNNLPGFNRPGFEVGMSSEVCVCEQTANQ